MRAALLALMLRKVPGVAVPANAVTINGEPVTISGEVLTIT